MEDNLTLDKIALDFLYVRPVVGQQKEGVLKMTKITTSKQDLFVLKNFCDINCYFTFEASLASQSQSA